MTETCLGERTRLTPDVIKDMETLANQQSFSFSRDQLSAMAMPNGAISIRAYTWMLNHFALIGDEQPGKGEIHIDCVEKREIYGEYLLDLGANNAMHHAIAESTFLKVWSTCLPYVKVRKYKVIMIHNIIIFYL
jgi:hypothetical protein